MVVDDSPAIRQLLRTALTADGEFEIVAECGHGGAALERIPHDRPEVVVLDVEMPVMGGLEALREIRRQHPTLPVIMFSGVTHGGARTTVEALELGASDYCLKPRASGTEANALRICRHVLGPMLKAQVRGVEAPRLPSLRPSRARIPVPRLRGACDYDVIVIGTSTGAPEALSKVLPALPGELPVPVLVVQHMPKTFTAHLAGRLDRDCALSVGEAAGGEVPEPGQVWLAPGGQHMLVRRRAGRVELALNADPPENSCRPAVDPLLRAAAQVHGGRVLAVVMTGMGYDGLSGCEKVIGAGGQVLAQDEASSVVWGMPGVVVAAGLADEVIPLDRIAEAILGRPVPGGKRRRVS